MASEVDGKILRAIHSLRKDNPLRPQAELVLADPSARIDDLQPILRAFDKWSQIRAMLNTGDQPVAVWLIKTANWSDGQRIALARALSRRIDMAAKARKLNRRLNGVFSVLVFCSCFCALIFIFQYPYLFGAVIDIALLYAVFGIAIAASSLLLERIFSLRCIRLTIECLGDLGQPVSLGSISRGLCYGQYREFAASALRKVTANLQPQHYGALPNETVPALCEALPKVEHATILVILNALNIIGDARAIKPVERLVVKSQSAEIGKAASELLPILWQREIESKAPTQLLRASENKAAGQQELLRGVSGVNPDEPALLVRASVGTPEEPR